MAVYIVGNHPSKYVCSVKMYISAVLIFYVTINDKWFLDKYYNAY